MSEQTEVSDGFCAEWVLKWATDESARASRESLKADMDERCRLIAENEWQKHNSDDGVGSFSSNPYQKRGDYADRDRVRLAEAALRWKAIQRFVSRRICACIDDRKEGGYLCNMKGNSCEWLHGQECRYTLECAAKTPKVKAKEVGDHG